MHTLSDLFDLSIHLFIFSSLPSTCSSCCLSPSSSLMSWTTTRTGYGPNDHFITEACVEFTQESVTEQRFPEDSDYDDVIIGQTLLNAYRRRADHSEEEGLSSSLSSSVSHYRTVRPVVCSSVERSKETQDTPLRMNRLGLSWNDKESKCSLTVKQRYENTNSKLITTEEVYKKIEWNDRVAKRNLSCSSRRRTTSKGWLAKISVREGSKSRPVTRHLRPQEVWMNVAGARKAWSENVNSTPHTSPFSRVWPHF